MTKDFELFYRLAVAWGTLYHYFWIAFALAHILAGLIAVWLYRRLP